MNHNNLLPRFAGAALFLVMAPSMAQAYIDPGNGAYMVQALFTLVGAALFYVRHPIRFFKECWHWMTNRSERVEATLEAPPESRGGSAAVDNESNPAQGRPHS